MPERRSATLLAMVVVLAPIAALAQSSPAASEFPRDRALLREALCGTRRSCRVESVLRAGRDRHGNPLAVVHLALRPGPPGARECNGYSDRLAMWQDDHVRELRELSRGDVRCLEWQPSTWSFENGELVFAYGGLGAPPSADTDMRPWRAHFHPWPLRMTAEYHGDDSITPLPTPAAHGPIFILSMDDWRAPY